MNNLFTKLVLVGILICLIVIAFKPTQEIVIPPSNPTIPPSTTSTQEEIIQISPNIIGVRDTGTGTGIPGQLLIFEYDNTSKSFKFSGASLNIQDYLTHPEKYGIPNKKK